MILFQKNDMKTLYILKIGGSIATYKNKPGFSVRKTLLKKIAKAIRDAQEKKNFDLVLIHGAGALGHSLAKRYGLSSGTGKDKKKWHGAILSRSANQKLNNAVTDIFSSKGVRVTPVHTASAIIQENKGIKVFNTSLIEESLRQNCVPVLYGDMVFDTILGMSICSGDVIAPHIAKKLGSKKIFFASDVEGIFTKDPYMFKDAKLIENIKLDDVHKKTKLSGSHNVDVTDGFAGKIRNFEGLRKTRVESVEIFNGFDWKNYENALLGKKFKHTTVHIK